MDNLNYILSIESKISEHYDFIKNHFDYPIDFDYQKFADNSNIYVITIRSKDENSTLIGVSVFRLFMDKINIDYVVIDKNYRQKGLNRECINVIEGIANSNYITYLTANIRKNNTNSIISFTKCGFQIDDTRKRKYHNGDRKIHVVKLLTI